MSASYIPVTITYAKTKQKIQNKSKHSANAFV